MVRRLAELAMLYGDSGPIEIPLRQDDLASMAGTTRPTANRVLRQLEDEGIVALRRGTLQVLDAAALAARAALRGRHAKYPLNPSQEGVAVGWWWGDGDGGGARAIRSRSPA